MALTDERGPASGEEFPDEPSGNFDRQPPQDRGAEQSVLGGMLLSKDAIADVVEVLAPGDFYRPAHQAVFDCILDLYGRGEPADPITVSAELERRGELGRVGGAPYLHTLIAMVPTAANAGYYAEIVTQKAILRRLVEAGTRIVQYGYGAGNNGDGSDVNEIVDRAQAAIYEVTERRTSEDFVPLEELLQPTMDEIDAIASRGGSAQGILTGFVDLDELTNGLHAGQMIIIAARPGIGKALALDTPLPTPSGWTTMGSVRVGDRLVGADGEPTTVLAATEVLRKRPCYEVGFSDGSAIVADAQHQWLTETREEPPPCDVAARVRTTEEIAATLELKHLVGKDDLAGGPEAVHARSIVDVRPVPSVDVRCVQVDAGDHLYLAGRSMVPTHNSTLGLDFARACSIRNGMTSVIFSLEMGRTEIVMRMLSAEAKIRLQDMRGGRMSDEDWTRLARRMSEISEAPLFIDDSPNMTMMEIRAKARRLKQRNDLQLIVVDYMQLMTSGKRVESRQQEVSEFSRQLKLLAKELDVPVVAISQLNRGPEQRTDKRPMLADLRESGCLTKRTRILRADTGAETTFGDLLTSGERPMVWSLDERHRLVPRTMSAVFPSGVKEVFRLRLSSGREVEASANHPFLTVNGWKPLAELGVGDRLAAPRRTPEPLNPAALPENEIVPLARQIADASRDYERFVPARVFRLPREQIGLFIHHLWARDGSLSRDGAGQACIHYASTSRRLVDDLARLLLRFGVLSRIEPAPTHADRDSWQLYISGAQNRRRFIEQIGVHGLRGLAAQEVHRELPDVAGRTNPDTVPPELWERVRATMTAQHVTRRRSAAATGTRSGGSAMHENAPRRAESQFSNATNDVFWDEVVEITSLGEQPVYDATVPGTHNFVADGIAVHNSLEQDADIVLLVSRPDAWERDDPRAGEADLILAKHRAGPVSTVAVAHQLHYSRFADLAQD